MNEATASNSPTQTAANFDPAPAIPVPTPGWQTSEFWMTSLGHAGLILAATSGALPAKYAAVAGALSQLAYNLSRGISKANAAR